MTIKIPSNNIEERTYIINQMLFGYLGLEYELEVDASVNDYVIIHHGRKLTFRDAFWNLYPDSLQYLNVDAIPEQIILLSVGNIHDVPVIFGNNELSIADNNVICGVDVFASSFFMLSRWEEFVLSRERTGKCEESQLLCVRSSMTKLPIVNIYLKLLVDLLCRIGVVVEYPNFFSVRITHDVDRCYLTSFQVLFSNLFNLAFKQKQYKKALASFKNYIIYRVKHYNPFLPFDELMSYSENYGFANSFYFKACIDSEKGCTYNVKDNIVKEVIDDILIRGHEVGFHPSESSYNNDEQFAEEFRRLKEVSTSAVIKGGRNHGLFYNMNTYRQWNELLSYDSGMGYQFFNGFRSGICFPYNVFDIFQKKRLNLVEFPFIAMDSVAMRRKWTPLETYEDVRLVCEIVNDYKGCICLNWHSNLINALERKAFKSVYFKIIDYVYECARRNVS